MADSSVRHKTATSVVKKKSNIIVFGRKISNEECCTRRQKFYLLVRQRKDSICPRGRSRLIYVIVIQYVMLTCETNFHIGRLRTALALVLFRQSL